MKTRDELYMDPVEGKQPPLTTTGVTARLEVYSKAQPGGY